jgi:hypothetical protein
MGNIFGKKMHSHRIRVAATSHEVTLRLNTGLPMAERKRRRSALLVRRRSDFGYRQLELKARDVLEMKLSSLTHERSKGKFSEF